MDKEDFRKVVKEEMEDNSDKLDKTLLYIWIGSLIGVVIDVMFLS